MAFIQCSFTSEVLNLTCAMNVIVPELTLEERTKFGSSVKFQTLYLLHGYSGDHTNWMRRTSIERYADENRIAVVMPAADNSFYTDMASGKKYYTYISEEIPRKARELFPLSHEREDNFIAGLSMGGYGAFKIALRNPEKFAAAASISGALDVANLVNDPTHASPDRRLEFINIFGDLTKIKNSENDLFYLAQNLKNSNTDIPKLYQACGTEDFLYEQNIKFKNFAKDIGLDLVYEEGPGEHTWAFWDKYIQNVLNFLPLKRQPVQYKK